MVQPPRGFGENPVAIYHDPDLPPSAPLPGRLPLARAPRRRRRLRRRRVVHLGKHGNLEWLPGKTLGMSAVLRHRRRARRPAADLPVPGQRPRRGHPGQAPRARHARRPPHPADGPRRDLRRHRPARAAARRARQHRRDGPGQAARDPRADLDADAGRQDWTTTSGWPTARTTTAFDEFLLHVDGWLCEIKDAQIRDGLHVLGPGPRRASAGRPGAGDPARPPDVGRRASAVPGLREALGLAEDGTDGRDAVDAVEDAGPRPGRRRWRPPAGTPTRSTPSR